MLFPIGAEEHLGGFEEVSDIEAVLFQISIRGFLSVPELLIVLKFRHARNGNDGVDIERAFHHG